MLEPGRVPRSQGAQAAHRTLALLLALVAIAGLTSRLFVHKMLVDTEGTASMSCGLRTCDSTYGTSTVSTSTLDLVHAIQNTGGDASSAWGYSGAFAWWTGLLAIVGLILAATMIAIRKYVRIPVMSPTTIALTFGGLALISACVFVASKPAGVGVTQIGWTFWTFGGGAVMSVIAAFLLSRQMALIEPEFDPGESPEMPPDEPWQD